VAHVKNTRPNLKKLEDRSTQMVLFGYEPGSAAYRVYDPAARRVQVSSDVVFDEDSSWDWSGALPTDGRRGELESFAVEYFCDQSSPSWNATRPEHALDTGVNGGARSERAPATPAAHGQASSSSTPATPRTPPPPQAEIVSPPTDASLPSPGEEAPRRYRTLQNLFDTTVTIEPEYSLMCLLLHDEPASFAEAEKVQGWRDAMNKEMESIEANKT
jgi:hypothetical protein